MKKLKLKKWVRNSLIVIAIIFALMILRNLQKFFVEECVKQGYTIEYCIKHS